MSAHAAAVEAALAEQAVLHDRTLAAQAAELGASHAAAMQQLQAEHASTLVAAQAAGLGGGTHAAAVRQLKAEHAAALAAHVCAPPPVTMEETYARHATNEACMRAAGEGDVKALQRGLAGLPQEEVRALRNPKVRLPVCLVAALAGGVA